MGVHGLILASNFPSQALPIISVDLLTNDVTRDHAEEKKIVFVQHNIVLNSNRLKQPDSSLLIITFRPLPCNRI